MENVLERRCENGQRNEHSLSLLVEIYIQAESHFLFKHSVETHTDSRHENERIVVSTLPIREVDHGRERV